MAAVPLLPINRLWRREEWCSCRQNYWTLIGQFLHFVMQRRMIICKRSASMNLANNDHQSRLRGTSKDTSASNGVNCQMTSPLSFRYTAQLRFCKFKCQPQDTHLSNRHVTKTIFLSPTSVTLNTLPAAHFELSFPFTAKIHGPLSSFQLTQLFFRNR